MPTHTDYIYVFGYTPHIHTTDTIDIARYAPKIPPFVVYVQVGSGADRFLAERAERTARVRVQNTRGKLFSEPEARQLPVNLSSNEILLQLQRTPHDARLWPTQDLVPAFLQSAVPFWQNVILPETPETERNTLLAWVKGVNVLDFIDPDTSGIYQDHPYSGAELTPVHLRNYVPDEFTPWVTDEVQPSVRKGCVARWADIADVSMYEKPHMVLPLRVQPKKPRQIWDARWLNLMCRHLPFTMDGVGKVAQCAWKGAYQVTIDHKAGYHHVALSTESWQYFGFECKGEFYVFTVLAFGWCSAPVIYAWLSEALARYLRSRGISTLDLDRRFLHGEFRAHVPSRGSKTVQSSSGRNVRGFGSVFQRRLLHLPSEMRD